MTEGFELLAKQKEISVAEMSSFIEEIIVRVFSKGPGFDHENEDMEAGRADSKFDIATGKVTLGSQEITTISKEDRGNVTEALTQFINSAKNGKQVLDNINKQLTEPETV